VIACSCRAVSDRAIRAAAAAGLGVADVRSATGAGSDCGCCIDTVERLVHEQAPTACSSPCPGCPRAGSPR
jgi:bacterioferritin-associated ferredoxin